jgi:hypothetical protein
MATTAKHSYVKARQVGTIQMNPEFCIITGQSAWGRANVRIDFGNGYYGYVLSKVYALYSVDIHNVILAEITPVKDK